MSSFTGKTPQALLAIATNAASILSADSSGVYNVPHAAVVALSSLDDELLNAINAQKSAQLAEKASTTAKLDRTRQVAQALTSIQAIVVQQSGVTTEMLDALGFSRRSSGKSQPRLPSAPTNLTVEAQSDGTAKLRWQKGATTPPTTSFLVEQSGDGINFSIIDSTRKSTYTATDVPPGVTCYFRITATTSMGRSGSSATVGVYLPGASSRPALKLAA